MKIYRQSINIAGDGWEEGEAFYAISQFFFQRSIQYSTFWDRLVLCCQLLPIISFLSQQCFPNLKSLHISESRELDPERELSTIEPTCHGSRATQLFTSLQDQCRWQDTMTTFLQRSPTLTTLKIPYPFAATICCNTLSYMAFNHRWRYKANVWVS